MPDPIPNLDPAGGKAPRLRKDPATVSVKLSSPGRVTCVFKFRGPEA